MDILKKLLNNPAFDHLAENIIGFMDTDEAMETMIESELLSDEERKVMRKMLQKLMVKEAQMYCEKNVSIYVSDKPALPEYIDDYYVIQTTLYNMYPFFKDALQELKNSDSLESFNQLYDILVWLQPGESQSADKTQLQHLYNMSDLSKKRQNCSDDLFKFKDHKGPEDMLEVFELANERVEDEDEDDYDGNDFEDWNYFSDASSDWDFPGNKYDYDSIMEYGLQW